MFAIGFKTYSYGNQNYPSFKPIQDLQLYLNIFISYTVLALLVDAFFRLNSLVKHDDLALSKCQMFMHIGAFVFAASIETLELASFIKLYK